MIPNIVEQKLKKTKGIMLQKTLSLQSSMNNNQYKRVKVQENK